MTALRFTAFVDLAQVRHRFQPKDASGLRPVAQPIERGRVHTGDDRLRRVARVPHAHPHPSALEQALHQAPGHNSLLYELRIFPAIGGMTKGARS